MKNRFWIDKTCSNVTPHPKLFVLSFLSYVDLLMSSLTLLNIIAVYSLSLSIIIFKKITKNSKMSLKLPIQGQQPNNRLSDSSENFRADRF